jgi:thiol-disulfide isomerase/thioredoxin
VRPWHSRGNIALKNLLLSRFKSSSVLRPFARLILCTLALVIPLPDAQGDFSVPLPDGDRLDVRVVEGSANGPLFVWFINQYGERSAVENLTPGLVERGATIWQVDLLESLFLERHNESVRTLGGGAVKALLDRAVQSDLRPVVTVAVDRMAAPVLRGMRDWQQQDGADPHELAGGVLFFPNLYRGTPVAGEEPELLGIAAATSLPVVVIQPELGTHRQRLGTLLDTLHQGGSRAYAWLIRQMRDYYLFHSETAHTQIFEGFRGPVPEDVQQALDAAPAQLIAAARLLSATPRPARVAALDPEAEESIVPAYGLVQRPGEPAPGFDLVDARGRRHTLDESLGRVTLVNFWATWCPPCVHEIPSMNRLAAAYEPDEFAIVSINFKEDAEHILEFMDQVQVDFPVLMDTDGSVAADWRVFAFPSSYLLDARGWVRYSVNTAIEWDTEEVRAVIDRLSSE